jgi:hypothetical protein
MNKINPEVLKRLDALMARFGVAAGEAWRALLLQSYADAISWLPFLFVWLGALVAAWFCLRWSIGRVRTQSASDCWEFAVACSGLAMVGFGAGIAACISSMLQILISPEGHALRDLLERI